MTVPTTLNTLQIREMIPHRYPFLLIDRVVDIVAGESATGIKCVTINEEFFQGHFPQQPVMPGVLIVEAMAQTAGALVVHSLGGAAAPVVYFMTIEKARFRKPVVPGDVMRMPVRLIRSRGPVWKFEGRAFVGDDLCAEAEFSAMITGAA